MNVPLYSVYIVLMHIGMHCVHAIAVLRPDFIGISFHKLSMQYKAIGASLVYCVVVYPTFSYIDIQRPTKASSKTRALTHSLSLNPLGLFVLVLANRKTHVSIYIRLTSSVFARNQETDFSHSLSFHFMCFCTAVYELLLRARLFSLVLLLFSNQWCTMTEIFRR